MIELIGDSDGCQMESILKRLGYSWSKSSVVDAAVLDANTDHARKKAKEMVERKLKSMFVKNEQAGQFFFEALKLDPESDKEFPDFVRFLKQALDAEGLDSITL